jgi:hypothetical protein
LGRSGPAGRSYGMVAGMLNQVLQEITNAQEPLSLTVLSSRLGIERGALEGMLTYWVRKGRLKDDDVHGEAGQVAGACGGTCSGASACSFVARMPRSYSVSVNKNDVSSVS